MNQRVINPGMSVIVVTAPSGAGKSSLCKHLLKEVPYPHMAFAISATNREKRLGEIHGNNYWFYSLEKIKEMIANNEFLEHEEVYPGKFYGTPVSEIERISSNGNHILLDIDVAGAISVKQLIPKAKVIFIAPPSVEDLLGRLKKRGDTKSDDIATRVQKAATEIGIAREMLGKGVFDASVLNADLNTAKKAVLNLACFYLGLTKTA